jgi:anti-sigma regulatory factor (Ser/Thr protein kinase)
MTAPSRLDEREVPRHSAALYASDDQLQDRVLPYVVDGLAREETVLVVVSAEAERVLRSGLGSAADQVQWAAPGISYARLGVMFESFRSYFAARRAAVAPTRLVSEYDVDGGLARMAAYLRYEAMSTDIYAPYGYQWACLWDERRHPADVLHQVREVHPLLLGPGGRSARSTDHVDPAEFLARDSGPLPAPPDDPGFDVWLNGPADLATLRRRLRSWAGARRSQRFDVDEAQIAVSEIATNALQHGGAPGRVRGWADGDVLVVLVEDRGPGGIPPTGGYGRPPGPAGTGAGLWLARQLADSVVTRSTPAGTSVELRF